MIYLNKFIKVNQLCGYLDKQYFLKQLSTQLLAIQQQYTYKVRILWILTYMLKYTQRILDTATINIHLKIVYLSNQSVWGICN